MGAINGGLLVLVGIAASDSMEEVRFVAEKCLNLRIFEDGAGKMNRSVLELGGEVLVVSQFTLYGDCRRGRRPSFVAAANAEASEPLYDAFVKCVRQSGLKTECGVFGAAMAVNLVNDGPVTLIVDKDREQT